METKVASTEKQTGKSNETYLEVLGDTVVPSSILLSVVISMTFSIGGYFVGKSIFPSIAEPKMVASYSLLLGIAGSVLALILCAKLFKPSRILKEEESSVESFQEILRDMQVDAKEEYQLIVNDPVTRKEMEELGILDTFKKSGVQSDK
ncbi:hypothetical protein T458_15490 [Brevibacillus panacihumi W25]|uniref:Uncharacterized protein n=1 Tax=Brevibacillus panacihumi W25 TaxID=1408254 RepID=V6M130_9BACL|nr:hypothetical protein [Brevibacillus panacihumi]EST52381.1 hypothetical protein T458_15490 [Brevibacillus panacihumi W25]